MGMTLNIPDSVLQGLRIPEGEIAQRLRTELAEMNQFIFGEILRQRRIARHYDDAELARDVAYARSE
jgi:predicted HTH domain antitoxin